MGGGGHKGHQSFTVSPAATDAPPEADLVVATAIPESAAFGELSDLCAHVGQAASHDDLVADVAKAHQLAAQAAADGVPAQLLADANQGLHHQAAGWLGQLPVEELQALAAVHGFAHPSLVGLSGSGAHPLQHWLDPTYPPDSVSKAQIAAKADERYALLAAGETIDGLSLADVDAAESGLANTATPGSWVATPEQVIAAQAQLSERLSALAAASPYSTKYPEYPQQTEALGAVIAAENHLTTASCPPIAATLAAAQASAKLAVDHGVAVWATKALVVRPVAAAPVEEGGLAPELWRYANGEEAVVLMRASTSLAERTALADAMTGRATQVAQFAELHGQMQAAGAHKVYGAAVIQLPQLVDGDGPAGLSSFAQASGQFYNQQSALNGWAPQALGNIGADKQLELPEKHSITSAPELTTAFRCLGQDPTDRPAASDRRDLGARRCGPRHPGRGAELDRRQLGRYLRQNRHRFVGRPQDHPSQQTGRPENGHGHLESGPHDRSQPHPTGGGIVPFGGRGGGGSVGAHLCGQAPGAGGGAQAPQRHHGCPTRPSVSG